MSTIDLNLENYDLEDLLKLFHLDINFGEDDLKQAKRMVMKTHPDKSNLPKEYFLFFSAAYKIIHGIHKFRGKSNCPSSTEYMVDEVDKGNKKIFDSLTKSGNFNKIFNELFEKHKLNDEDVENGYGEWLKSNEDIDNRETTKLTMNQDFERKKHEVQTIIKHKDVEYSVSSLSGQDLCGDQPDNYSASMFSSLQYEDLKKAHVESVIPVTSDDYRKIKKYKDENDIKKQRDSQNITPISLQQAREQLESHKLEKEKNDTYRAFKLAKRDEQIRKENDKIKGHFLRLK